jgi:hypothetical protein
MNAKGGPAVAYTEQRLQVLPAAIPLITKNCHRGKY